MNGNVDRYRHIINIIFDKYCAQSGTVDERTLSISSWGGVIEIMQCSPLEITHFQNHKQKPGFQDEIDDSQQWVLCKVDKVHNMPLDINFHSVGLVCAIFKFVWFRFVCVSCVF